MQDYEISLAQLTDLSQIVEIYNSTVQTRQSTADLEPTTVEKRLPWFNAHKGNRPMYVVKNKDGEVLAWGSFSDYYPRQAYHISAEISVYIHENMRGKGLGKLLVNYMLERAPTLGIHNVLAVIFGHNQASIRLFQSFGFEKWGLLPKVCDLGTFEADIVILGKHIMS